MRVEFSPGALDTLNADAVAALVFAPEEGESPEARLEAWTGGLASEIFASGEFRAKPGSTVLVHRPAGLAARRLLLVGAGKRGEFAPATVRRGAAAAARALKTQGVRRLALAWPEGLDAQAAAQAAVEGAVLGEFEPGVYKTENPPQGAIDQLVLNLPAEYPAAAERGLAVGEAQNYARRLANEPGNRMTPTVLVERARELAAETGLEIEALDRAALEALGAGALLGVAQGSDEPPAMIVLRYRPPAPPPEGAPHLGLIGKAVTFDTGGVSIKPAADMDRMKYDMAGGAAVLAAMRALAALRPRVAVTAVVPAVENMLSGRAQRPGDVVRTVSGKTVEVLNTDAEGRLILADAIGYALGQGCDRLVDFATLTGAIVVALGYERGGLFSNDPAWRDAFLAAAEAAGERYWPMPLDAEYREQLDSGIADLANIGSRWGGAVTAAKFLESFVDSKPWVHLDIAGTAWLEAAKPDAPKGPTGVGVRSMVALAMSL